MWDLIDLCSPFKICHITANCSIILKWNEVRFEHNFSTNAIP